MGSRSLFCRQLLTVIALNCTIMTASAQEGSWLSRNLRKLGNILDTMSVKGVDPKYITVPKYPCQMDLRMTSHFYSNDVSIPMELHMQPRMKTNIANNIGVWAGYRGYGVGYSIGIGRQSGSYFTIGATGSSYGFNLRLRTFRTFDPELHVWGKGIPGSEFNNGNPFEITETDEMEDPIRVRSLIIDGYYLFNGKHFSHCAAFDQSAIQLRSAGSLMAGAMWHNTTIRYNDDSNAAMIFLMHDIGVIKIRQGSIGVGYAYNWVPIPGKGLLVSALAMPMLTVINYQKVELFSTYLSESDDVDGNTIEFRDSSVRRSNMTVTFDARLSLTYNWDRFFINAYGQWNHYHYDYEEEGGGWLNDWFINASLGFRF